MKTNMYKPIQLQNPATLFVKNSINRSPLRYCLFLVVLALSLWTVPGTAHGQVVGGDLFATVNLEPFNNGGSALYQYTPQYLPPDGTPNIFASNLDHPRGVAFDSAGNLFVATFKWDLDSDGNILGYQQGAILKISGGVASTFATFVDFGASGLVTDSAGNVFVMSAKFDGSASNIYKVIPDGTVTTFGYDQGCACSIPGQGFGLAFDSSGNLYAACAGDPTGTAQGIYKFTPQGVRSTFVDSTAFPSEGPVGLAFNASGNLFVSTEPPNGNGEIRKFAPDGTEITPPFATGLTKNPRGLAFDSAGNLFVAEIGGGGAITGDILEFTPEGTQNVFASQNFGFRSNRGPEFLAFSTAAVTPPSSAVILTLPNATAPLTATVTSIDQNSVPPPPSNFVELSGSNLAFDISTTVTPTPPIIIAFTVPSSAWDAAYDATTMRTTLKVMHYECDTENPPNCQWQDRTIYSGDPNYPSPAADNTIYGNVPSLSPFLIAKFQFGAPVQQPINANGTSVFSVRRGVIPVKFTLTQDGTSTCTLPPATIAVTRTAGGTTGAINESVYNGSADNGSNFRIASCQYAYNLNSSALGVGTYRVDIKINGTVAGSATFQLK